MDNQEQRKLIPSGRENHICNKCGWAYPNPHPSAKHRRAHKKNCGKPLGFKAIDSDDRFSDDEQQQNYSDYERLTPLPKIDKVGQSSDGVGGRPNKSEDEMFADAVTEFSPVDTEKSVERIEDSSPLLKAHAIADSASSPGTEGSYVGLSHLDVNVERAVEVDLDSCPLLKVDASTERPDVGVVEDNNEKTKKMDGDELNEVVVNAPEHVPRNLSGSFEAEIKSLECDGNTCLWKEDGVGQSEQEQGGGSELKMSDILLKVEPIDQSEENYDASNNGDLRISGNTKTEGEAVHILSGIPIAGDSDKLIEYYKDHDVVKADIFTLDSAKVICPLIDGDKDTNMNTRDDSIKDNSALDTDFGGLSEDSCTTELSVAEYSIEDFKDHRVLNSEIPPVDVKPLGDSDRVPVDTANLSDTNEQESLINEVSEIHPNESTEVVFNVDTNNMIQNTQKCADEEAWEDVNEIKISNAGENVKQVNSAVMESESVGVEVSEASILKEEKSPDELVEVNNIVDEGDVERANEERISDDPITQEPSFKDNQNKENEQVASALDYVQEKGKDSPTKDHSGIVDLSADLSSQNSLEANWGSASVLSDARPSVDADSLRLSPQEPAKPEENNFKNSGHGLVNQSDTLSVVERGGGLDQNDAFIKPESAQQPKTESVTDVSNESEERKKNEEVIAKVTNWGTEKHQSTPLKSLLGESDAEKGQQKSTVITTTVKSVLSNEAPAPYQTMNRDGASKEWNSPEKYPGSKKDRKKVKGKSSWVPFVCCSSVNVS